MKKFILAVLIVLIIGICVNWGQVEKFAISIINGKDDRFKVKTKINGNQIHVFLWDNETYKSVSYFCEVVYNFEALKQGEEKLEICENCVCRLWYNNNEDENIVFYLDPKYDIIFSVGFGIDGDKEFLCSQPSNAELCKNAYEKMEYYKNIMRWHEQIEKLFNNYKQPKDKI